MKYIALTALVILMVAAFLGFGPLASAAAGVAMTVLYIAVVVLVATALMALLSRAGNRTV